MWRFVFLLLLLGAFGVSDKQWSVHVFTANHYLAGTDSGIFITLHGNRANSEEIELDNKNNNFEQGFRDRFYIRTPDIGLLCSVRIRSDGVFASSGWKLRKIEIYREGSDAPITFTCWCWLEHGHLEQTIYNDSTFCS